MGFNVISHSSEVMLGTVELYPGVTTQDDTMIRLTELRWAVPVTRVITRGLL